MNQNYKEAIQFSKKEIRGILALILISTLLSFSSNLVNLWNDEFSTQDLETVKVQQIALELLENGVIQEGNLPESGQKFKNLPKFYLFDPNTLDIKSWMEFGLSEKQAQSIHKYTSKGGRFYRAEDLGKMYVISPKLYEQLKPYVRITNDNKSLNLSILPEIRTNKESTFTVININLADSLQLLDLKGIGPSFARRILAYRKRLGGFVSPSQLLEIYGFDSLRLISILPRLKFGNDLTQIDINTITFEELRKHPYLSYSQAQALIQYRKQHGTFKSEKDLLKIKALDTGVVKRLSPYLLL